MGDSSILVTIDEFTKRQLPNALRSKKSLDFEKHKERQDWEKKLLDAVFGGRVVSSV